MSFCQPPPPSLENSIDNAQNAALSLGQQLATNNNTLNQQNAVNALAAQFQAIGGDYTTILQDEAGLE